MNAIKQLQEIYGAYGYLIETGIEREYRDSFASLLYSGTSAIQRNIISADV
ncbi:MAG: acyl-CoA/acyl-ACP dehydrogenase [Sphingobacteriaceae bacterium]|nr:acyl-CoA/acyl-ACP dehydrogenase [Sphingobacteriaceae bacterium]